MQVQSFTARSIQEALEKVRRTLGPNAVILSTESQLEESAGSTPQRIVTVQSCRQENLSTARSQAKCHPIGEAEATLSNERELATSYIEQLYQKEQQKLEAQKQQYLFARQQRPEDFVPRFLTKTLLNSGMDMQQIRKLLQTIPADTPDLQIPACIESQLKQIVTTATLNLTTVSPNQSKPLTVVLTGRSGTGKSTLAMKLATQCELREEQSIAVIELTGQNRQQHFWMHLQMQSLGIRTAQVANSAELDETLKQFSDCTAVFIDTPAISTNPQHIALINAMVQDISADYCLLTHDVQTLPQATVQLAQALRPSCPLMMALTKIDEGKALGHLVSLFQQITIPVTLLSHSAGLADGFTHMTESVHSKLIQRMTGLESAKQDLSERRSDLKTPLNENQAQDSFTLNLNPT